MDSQPVQPAMPLNTLLRYGVFSLLLVLLIFGVSFSKFSLGGALYINDVLLVMITGLAFFGNPAAKIPVTFFVFALISILYFLASFVINRGVPIVYIFRQFMICGYFIESLIIYTSLFQRPDRYAQLLAFLKRFAVWAFYADLIYAFFLMISGRNLLSGQGYVYISPLAVLGVIVFFAYTLVGKEKYKWLKLFTAFILVALTGHASAVLAILLILVLYLASYVQPAVKAVISLGSLVVVPTAFLIFRSLSDANAVWRLVYWGYTARRIFVDHVGILGYGFGVRYADEELARLMKEVYKFSATLKEDADAFVTPLHNAFLTFSFHLGFLPALLIIVPILLAILRSQAYRKTSKPMSDDERILGLCVSGLAIWVGFNVILELPHSSLFFWIIFFAYSGYRKYGPPAKD